MGKDVLFDKTGIIVSKCNKLKGLLEAQLLSN